MTVDDEIRDILRRYITLHEKLRDIIKEESASIEKGAVDSISDKTAQKKEIEQEIKHVHQTVVPLLENYYRNSMNIHSESDDEIGQLVEKLHKSVNNTITTIGETVEAFKAARKDVVNQLKYFDNNKNAINAYAKIQQ